LFTTRPPAFDRLQFRHGGPEELLALVRAERRERRVPARHEPFTRIRRVRQFKEIAVVKEPELQRATF
jgi:hypothetical protein